MFHALKLDPSPRPATLREAEPAPETMGQSFAGCLAQASVVSAAAAAAPPPQERSYGRTESPAKDKAATKADPESKAAPQVQTGLPSKENQAEVAENPPKPSEPAQSPSPDQPPVGISTPIELPAALALPIPAMASLPAQSAPVVSESAEAVPPAGTGSPAKPTQNPSPGQPQAAAPALRDPAIPVFVAAQPAGSPVSPTQNPTLGQPQVATPAPVAPPITPATPAGQSAPTSREPVNSAVIVPQRAESPAKPIQNLNLEQPQVAAPAPTRSMPAPPQAGAGPVPRSEAQVAPVTPAVPAAPSEQIIQALPNAPAVLSHPTRPADPALSSVEVQRALAQTTPGPPLRFTFSEGSPEAPVQNPDTPLPALAELLAVPRPDMEVPLPADQAFLAQLGKTTTPLPEARSTAILPETTAPAEVKISVVLPSGVPPPVVVPKSALTAPAPAPIEAKVATLAPGSASLPLPVENKAIVDTPAPSFVAMMPTRPATAANQPTAATILQSMFVGTRSPEQPVAPLAISASITSEAPPAPTPIAEPTAPAASATNVSPRMMSLAPLQTLEPDLPVVARFVTENFASLLSNSRNQLPEGTSPTQKPLPPLVVSRFEPMETPLPVRREAELLAPAPSDNRAAVPPPREVPPPNPPNEATVAPPAAKIVVLAREAVGAGVKATLPGEPTSGLHGSTSSGGWAPVGLTIPVRAVAAAQSHVPNPAFSQMEGGIQWLIKNQEKAAEIQLNPESLGRVVIKLVVEGGEVHARVWASEASTVTLLQNQKGALEASLHQQGLTLGSFDLQQGRRGHDTPTAPQQSSFNSGAKFADSQSGKQDVPTTTLPVLNGSRLLEVFA